MSTKELQINRNFWPSTTQLKPGAIDHIRAHLPSTSEMFKIWSISWPVIVTNVLQILILVADTAMVGRLGPDAIAAIGMGNALRLFLFILVLSVSAGSISLMSQAYGTGDPKRMSQVLKQSLIAGLLVSLFLGITGLVIARPILSWMDQSQSSLAVDSAYQYLVVIFIGLPFLVLNLVSERLMQGAGDTMVPMLLSGVTVIINIALNYIFIFGWGPVAGFGLVGAAYGTILARGLILIIYMALFKSRHYHIGFLPGDWWPNVKLIRSILDIGIPSGLQGIFRRGAALFLVGFATATQLGTMGAAALTIGWQIESVIVQVLVGINVASTTMVGYWLGRWQVSEARKTGNVLMLLGVAFASILILPIVFFPDSFIRLFDPSANALVIEGARGFIYTSVLTLPFAAVSIIATGAMRGAGDTKPPMYSTIWFRCLGTLALAYVLTFTLDLDYMGVWYAIVIGRLLDTMYMVFLWLRKRWVRVALSNSPLYLLHLNKLSPGVMQDFLRNVRTPMMSVKHTSEIVETGSVRYHHPDFVQTVFFEGDHYHTENSGTV